MCSHCFVAFSDPEPRSGDLRLECMRMVDQRTDDSYIITARVVFGESYTPLYFDQALDSFRLIRVAYSGNEPVPGTLVTRERVEIAEMLMVNNLPPVLFDDGEYRVTVS